MEGRLEPGESSGSRTDVVSEMLFDGVVLAKGDSGAALRDLPVIAGLLTPPPVPVSARKPLVFNGMRCVLRRNYQIMLGLVADI